MPLLNNLGAGAGWSEIMKAVVAETSVAMYWFFVSYVFVVGVLFTQLLISILLDSFSKAEESTRTVVVRAQALHFAPDEFRMNAQSGMSTGASWHCTL